MTNVDIAALIVRVALGITMLAHGYNHAFGGGKLPGTARWFESIGIRPGRVHALLATLTELGVAPLLFLGLVTPLAAAGVLGVMLGLGVDLAPVIGHVVLDEQTELHDVPLDSASGCLGPANGTRYFRYGS